MESSLELSPSASSLRGRSFGRGDPRAPWLAGSFEPGLAAPRHGRLRVLHGELSRTLTFGIFVARTKLLPRGPARRLGGSSTRTPSRLSWRALSSSHLRPLRCEAEASAAGTLAPRGWRAPPSLAWRLLAADAFASFMLLPRGPARPAASWLL